MTDEEAAEVYEALAEVIGKSELAWVLGQVEGFVREGKPAPPQPRVSQRPAKDRLLVPETEKLVAVEQAVKGEFRRTDSYTDRERLALLIDGIEEALRTVPAMRGSAADTLRRHGAAEVRFVPELERREEVSLTVPENPEHLKSLGRARELFEAIKREV